MENQAVQTFTAKFLYPGIANYDRDTTLKKVLINKHIDQIAKAHIGVPMTIGHTDPADLPEGDDRIVGRVTNVFLNKDGFTTKEGVFVEPDQAYYCEFFLNKPEALEAWSRLGYVSCAWEGLEFIRPERNEMGQLEKLTFINNEYEAELVRARGLHMAIVDNPRYEDAIIFKNSMATEIKEVTSTIEIEKGVFLNYVSSAAGKAKDLALEIFSNAKKAKKNDDSYNDDMEEEDQKENGKKAKNAKKAKKNEAEEKEEKENERHRGFIGSDEEAEALEEDNSKDNSVKENSLEIDGEAVSHETLIECYRNAKKAKKNEAEEEKDEKENEKEKDEESKENSVDTKENSVVKTNSGFVLGEAMHEIKLESAKAATVYVSSNQSLFH